MATRYWVGGTGIWDASTTTNWSTVSGGTSGATAPSVADDVVFDANSGTGTVTTSGFAVSVCKNFTYGNSSTAFTGGSGYGVYGNFTTTAAIAFAPYLLSSANGNIITTNEISVSGFIFNGTGSWTLAGSINCHSIFFLQGTLNTGNYSITTTNSVSISGSGVKVLNLGSTAWRWSLSFASSTATNLTVNGTYKLIMSQAAGTAAFNINTSFVCNELVLNGAAAVRIFGGPTITTISNTSFPATIRLNAGNTFYTTNLNLRGKSGNLVTINSYTAGITATISKSSGTVNSDYLSIKDITATGGAIFYAGANSVDNGNNTGWIFSSGPPAWAKIDNIQSASWTDVVT